MSATTYVGQNFSSQGSGVLLVNVNTYISTINRKILGGGGFGPSCYRYLTLFSAKAIIVPHCIIWSWYTGHWWVGCCIWYSHSLPRPILAVPNAKSHPSSASVPITILLCNGPLFCGFNVGIKGLDVTSGLWRAGSSTDLHFSSSIISSDLININCVKLVVFLCFSVAFVVLWHSRSNNIQSCTECICYVIHNCCFLHCCILMMYFYRFLSAVVHRVIVFML